MKICKGCKIEKEFSLFYKNPALKDGHEGKCKKCRIRKMSIMTEEQHYKRLEYSGKYQIEYRKLNKELVSNKSRNYNYKKRYNITVEDYYNLLDSQDYKCAICKTSKISRKYFDIDHNHITGKVRGLLCNLCNKSLGSFKDSIENLQNAIKYLEKYQDKPGINQESFQIELREEYFNKSILI